LVFGFFIFENGEKKESWKVKPLFVFGHLFCPILKRGYTFQHSKILDLMENWF
jgi:hypothetical protein